MCLIGFGADLMFEPSATGPSDRAEMTNPGSVLVQLNSPTTSQLSQPLVPRYNTSPPSNELSSARYRSTVSVRSRPYSDWPFWRAERSEARSGSFSSSSIIRINNTNIAHAYFTRHSPRNPPEHTSGWRWTWQPGRSGRDRIGGGNAQGPAAKSWGEKGEEEDTR